MNSHNPATFYLRRAQTQALPALGTPSRTVSSDAIFRGEREIGIEHHGAIYRLKVTRQGKLILNK
ncbi:hemin uptake protein HemP [Mesorhizobium sp. PUT5]|uniref:hemin uptake protein HemP n=1 Tax=Mesorhizobium sp. PUT5 TaxID=3454629 RepID=UPI003FA4421D